MVFTIRNDMRLKITIQNCTIQNYKIKIIMRYMSQSPRLLRKIAIAMHNFVKRRVKAANME